VTDARPPRIGIFGGTFDPIHAGHLRAAARVRDRFKLDRVLFVPSFIPPHKRRAGLASPAERLAMVEQAVVGRRGFAASAVEVGSRATSYSIITLAKVRRLYPAARLFFILGADAFREIETWREWRRVLAQCAFIVTTRPGTGLGRARSVLDPTYRRRAVRVDRGTRIDERFLDRFGIFFLAIDALPLSSTGIRRRVREGRPLRGLVPGAVARIIEDHELYRPSVLPWSGGGAGRERHPRGKTT
jgi:nicotinate-nucleotide adenylyltransferase